MNLAFARSLYRELTPGPVAAKPLVVGGAKALAPMLRRELGVAGTSDDPPRAGGAPEGAAVYVHIWAGDGEDDAQLKRARKARVPIVALAPEEVDSVPYVLATDIVPLRPGSGFPIEELTRVIAARLDEAAVALAARLPVLRRAVAQQLIARTARTNGLIGAAVFIPGVDLPILLRNELRLVSKLEQLYGYELIPGNKLPELVGAASIGYGLRALARQLLDVVPVAGWAIKGGVAYAGTRALGEATLRRLEALHPPGSHR